MKEDFATEMRLRRLEAKVAYLLTRGDPSSNGSGALPAPMDFMVDMFDRKDNDAGTGRYWQGGGFSIRTKRAVCVNGDYLGPAVDEGGLAYGYETPAHHPINIVRTDSTGINQSGHVLGASAGALAAFYLHPMTSTAFSLKVTFDGPRGALAPFPFSDGYWNAPVMSAGLAFANDRQAKLGGWVNSIAIPGSSGMTAGQPFDAFWNPGSAIQTLQSMGDPLAGGNGSLHAANTITLTASDSNYEFAVNGAALYSGANPLLAERKFVGLYLPRLNWLADAIRMSVPFYGLTGFKAWRSDIPEPANESGHGIYKDSKHAWADGYHKPVIDPTTKTITGYTYNPNAFST